MTLRDMNTEVIVTMISALQATSEALAEVAPLLPPERRAAFDEKTRRILVAKTELMLAKDSAR